MTRSDRIFGSSKTAAMLQSEQSIEEGMAELGRALEKQIAKQERAEKRPKKTSRASRKRVDANG